MPVKMQPPICRRKHLIALFTGLSAGYGITTTQYAFGFFVEPLTDEFGWTRAEINASLSIGFGVAAMVAPLMGIFMSKWGPKNTLMLSLLLVAVGFVIRGVSTNLGIFYFSNILSFIAYPPLSSFIIGDLISRWFPTQKNRAIGLTATLINVTGFAIGPIMAQLMIHYNWRFASFMIAAYGGFLLVVSFFVVKDDPKIVTEERKNNNENIQNKKTKSDVAIIPEISKDCGVTDRKNECGNVKCRNHDVRDDNTTKRTQISLEIERNDKFTPTTNSENPAHEKDDGMTVKEALCSRNFHFITISVICGQFVFTTAIANLVPHFLNVGLSSVRAANLLSIVSIGGTFSKIIFGFLGAKITTRYAICVNHFVNSIGLLVIILTGSSDWVFLGAVVFGLGYGGVGVLLVTCILESVGKREYSKLSGFSQFMAIIPGVIGPLYSGFVFDNYDTWQYEISFIILVGIWVLGIIFALAAGKSKFSEKLKNVNI